MDSVLPVIDRAQLSAICDATDGTEPGVGMSRLTDARIEWTIRHDEVLIVLDGNLTVQLTGSGVTHSLQAHAPDP